MIEVMKKPMCKSCNKSALKVISFSFNELTERNQIVLQCEFCYSVYIEAI